MSKKQYEIKDFPFIDNIPHDGRVIPSIHFFDKKRKKFRSCVNYKGKYIELESGGQDLIKGLYWSKHSANHKRDLYMDLINILSNNFSFSDEKGKNRGIIDITSSIVQDIHNFGAIIHKQLIIWDYIKSLKKKPSRSNAYDIYATEIEYLMGLVRSFFDLIYKLFILISEISEPKLINLNLKKVNTLGKLSDRIIKDIKNKKLSQVEVLKSYGVADPFVGFFDTILPLFRLCRRIRDGIYHGGKTPQIIFITENGPGIGMKNIDPYFRDPYSSFKDFFKDEPNFHDNLLDNDIVSLFYFINIVIGYSLDYSEMFGYAMRHFYKQMPENISNEYKIFIKGPEIKYINKIPNNLIDAWLEPLNKSFFKPEYMNFLDIE